MPRYRVTFKCRKTLSDSDSGDLRYITASHVCIEFKVSNMNMNKVEENQKKIGAIDNLSLNLDTSFYYKCCMRQVQLLSYSRNYG